MSPNTAWWLGPGELVVSSRGEPMDRIIKGDDGVHRCFWGAKPEVYMRYHDEEWGQPTADDRWIFEKLCLEGFQSGLSWLTILKKRENFRAAFENFDVEKVARFNQRSVERLMQDAGIVRNRAKIEATINNAKRALELRDELGSLASFVWKFEPKRSARPKTMDWDTLVQLSTTAESIALSKALKKRGWRFVGPTTMYAFMQAAGLVNDHLDGCAARKTCSAARRRFSAPG